MNELLTRIDKSQSNWLESHNGVRFLDVDAGFLFLWPPSPAGSDRCAIGYVPRSERRWAWLGDTHGVPVCVPLGQAVRTAESLAETEYGALTVKDDPRRDRRVLDGDTLVAWARDAGVAPSDGMRVGQLEDAVSRRQADDALPELGRDHIYIDGLPETAPLTGHGDLPPRRRGVRRDDLEAGLDIPEVDLPPGPPRAWLVLAAVVLSALMVGAWHLGWRWAPTAVLLTAVGAVGYEWRNQLRNARAEAVRRVSASDTAYLSDLAELTGDADGPDDADAPTGLTVKEREQLLRRELSEFIAGRPFHVSRRGPLHAVVVSRSVVRHRLYAALSVLTLGLWLPIWLFVIWYSRDRQWMVFVDRDGGVRRIPIS